MSLNAEKTDIPTQGRVAGGVKGISLNKGDKIKVMSQVDEEGEFITITAQGFYKKVIAGEIEPSQRYRKGVKIVTLGKGDKVVYAGDVKSPFDLAVIDNCRRASYGYDQRVEAFGSLGQVAIGNDTDSLAVISNADGVTAEKPKLFFLERYMQAYTAEVDSFIQAVVNDTPTEVNVVDGLKPVLIGLAAKLSLKENRPVKIAEIEAQYGL